MKFPFVFLILLKIIFVQDVNAAFPPLKNLKENIDIAALPGENIKKLLFEAGHFQFVLSLAGATVINEGGILTADGYILRDTQTRNRDQHRLKKPRRNLNNENPLYFRALGRALFAGV